MERFDEAIRAYSNEIGYDSASIKALNNRAFCYSKLGDQMSAVEDYNSVLELDPTNIHALHNKGILLQRVSKFEKVSSPMIQAIDCFSRLIELTPDSVGAYFNRGCCFDR